MASKQTNYSTTKIVSYKIRILNESNDTSSSQHLCVGLRKHTERAHGAHDLTALHQPSSKVKKVNGSGAVITEEVCNLNNFRISDTTDLPFRYQTVNNFSV